MPAAAAAPKNVFSAARGKHLTDAQLEQYIDPSVTGADRVLARRLMKLMPSNERGDFVYVDSETHFFSNNPASIAELKITRVIPKTVAAVRTTPNAPTAGTRKPQYDWTNVDQGGNSCTPRHPYQGSGPYVRMMSKCGFGAAIGFVQIPCGTSGMAPGDNGYTYFEVSRGLDDAMEAGLIYASDTSIAPYIRSTQAGLPNHGYLNITNGTTRYTCSKWLGVAGGVVKVDNNQMIFTRIGEVPSNFDPVAFWSGNQPVSFNRAAWLFSTAPPGMRVASGVDNVGVPAPCWNCAVGKVTSIAQTVEAGTGSYFGIDGNGKNAIQWLQLAYGNWLVGCRDGQLCTMKYSRDWTKYFAGFQFYQGYNSGPYAVQVDGPTQSGFGPWQTFDGIGLDLTLFNAYRAPAGAFSSVQPPNCSNTDAYGYCVAQSGGPGFHEDYVTCNAGGYGTLYGPVNVGTQYFWIQDTYGVLQQFTHHAFDGTGGPECWEGDWWDPGEPKSQLGDPNLP